MVFEAKYQSFKMLLVILILVGSTFVGNCQAERTPISLNSRSFCQELLGSNDVCQLKKANHDRQRAEKLWFEFKQFASGQVSTVKQKLASLNLRPSWDQLSDRSTLSANQRPNAKSSTVTPSTTAMAVELAANMTAMQWLQASKLTTDLLESGHQRVTRTTIKIEAEMQASLLRLIESTSSNIVQVAGSLWANGVIQAMAVAKSSETSSADSLEEDSRAAITSTEEDSASDPYWLYYADCDFWGAEFEAAAE